MMRLMASAVIMLTVLFALSGCGSEVATDDTGGISSDAGSSANTNLVNTSQLPDSSFIYDVPINDLEKADSYMDGQTVQVVGEVVGDRIASEYDGNYCWLTLQATDGSYSEVSSHMPISYTSMVDTYGAYGKRGTTLQVRGTFNLACKDHDGVTDIHADTVTLVNKGEISTAQVDPARFALGACLVIVAGLLSLLYWRLSEKRR